MGLSESIEARIQARTHQLVRDARASGYEHGREMTLLEIRRDRDMELIGREIAQMGVELLAALADERARGMNDNSNGPTPVPVSISVGAS